MPDAGATRLASTVLLLTLSACAHAPPADGTAAAEPRGVVEARQFVYADNSGLTVATTAASIDHRVSPHTSIYVRAVGDYIRLRRKQIDPSDPTITQVTTGHRDADVVTSASALPSGGGSTDKWRAEVAAGPQVDGTLRGARVTAGLVGRVSFEPDYRSYSAVGNISLAVLQQNLTLAAFVGFGHDDVIPPLPPGGQAALWPASHDRVTGGVTAAQIVSRRLVLSVGAAGSRQQGQLASPYRRALVKTTLFPETVPDVRARATGFAGLSTYAGWGTGIHLRLGGYADSWGVEALIPEAAIAKEIGPRWLIFGQYRFYAQTAADFYQPVYGDIMPIMSGDPRLGRIESHVGGLGAEWRALPNPASGSELAIFASFEGSLVDYILLRQRVWASITSVGVTLSY